MWECECECGACCEVEGDCCEGEVCCVHELACIISARSLHCIRVQCGSEFGRCFCTV
jgi:hypothetical protein